jgi:glycosyltransferase involved in cell wall biosynthesis
MPGVSAAPAGLSAPRAAFGRRTSRGGIRGKEYIAGRVPARQTEAGGQQPDGLAGPLRPCRPRPAQPSRMVREIMISVCVATYNGSRYITEQLISFLPQLERQDEIIVVDDRSTDSTVDTIKAIGDARIKIYRNPENIGVKKTFERGIRLAKGEIIFLADQDDIWMEGKVLSVKEAFRCHPEVTLFASDAVVIDSTGRIVSDSIYSLLGRFTKNIFLNFVKNKFLGCTLAFKKDMTAYLLPIPETVPMHDIWIGMINGIFGKTFYSEVPLVRYRRHEKNLTAIRHSTLQNIIRWRCQLMKQVVKRWFEIATRRRKTAQRL